MSSYSFYIGDRLLPVAPGRLEIKYGDKLKRIDMASGHEIVFPETARLAEVRFSALLPTARYPFAVYTNGFVRGSEILREMLLLRERGKPFRFIVLRKTYTGGQLSTNMKVVFSEIASREEAGEGSDLYIDVKLVEYKDFAIKNVVTNSLGGDSAGIVTRPVDTAPVVISYIVVRGDSLWMIAHRFLGNGNRWPEIYNLNKDNIDARNKGTGNPYYTIYPGQVFRLS